MAWTRESRRRITEWLEVKTQRSFLGAGDVADLLKELDRTEGARKGWEVTAHTYAVSRDCQEERADRERHLREQIEQRCDPAGDTRALMLTRDENRGLMAEVLEVKQENALLRKWSSHWKNLATFRGWPASKHEKNRRRAVLAEARIEAALKEIFIVKSTGDHYLEGILARIEKILRWRATLIIPTWGVKIRGT